MTTKVRNSNFELLRIIAMLFIVIWHISIHAQRGELATHNIAIAFTTTGVNLFVLISGYFNIKINWKGLLTLASTVAFYTFATVTCKWCITGKTPMPGEIAGILAPICNTRWWFINSYFHLMLFSPVINLILEKATNKQYKYFLITLLFMSCISGFCLKNLINLNGYNTFQFITMYTLGDAIRRFNLTNKFSKKHLLTAYLLCTLCLFVSSFIAARTIFYNNPLVIVAAVCLFCLVAKLEFSNRTVNYIASFMLPIYLLQDSCVGFIAYKYLYDIGVITNFKGFDYCTLIFIYLLILTTSAFILDWLRRVFLKHPITAISKFLDKKFNLFN